MTISYLPDGEGVVEVLGILGVDGTGEHMAEVLSAGNLLLADGGIDALGRLLHVLGILVGQVVLRQDGVHLGIVVARLPEYVYHAADDVLVLCIGPLYHLHHGLVVGLAALQLALGYDDVVDEVLVLGDEHGQLALHHQLAYYLLVGVVHYLDDHSLLDVPVAAGHVGHLHAVAVHSRHRVALSHEDGGAAIVGQERVAPRRLAAEGALLQLRLHVQAVAAVAHLQQEVVPRHLLHHVDGKHLQRVLVELEGLEYLLEREGLVRIMLEEFLEQFGDLLLP